MVETEYLTQILFGSTKHEDAVVFFRRFQKALWNMLPHYFPWNDKNGKGIRDALPFNIFCTERSFSVGVGPHNNVTGRNLETAKLCAHSIIISIPGESEHVKGQSDNTQQIEICIESAKITAGKSPVIRFSYTSRIVYQPFAGFYPLAKKVYGTPEVVEQLLKLPDSEAQFMQRIDCIKGQPPRYKYPVCHKVIRIKDREHANDFLARLQDRARPIPFVVYMGGSSRMQAETEMMIPHVYAKAWVYLVERPDLVRQAFSDVVPGIDVDKDVRSHACRLFFPFGSYRPEDFANPSYRVGLFGRGKYREQLLNGLLRFFDIDEPGWRRTQRDIHMTQLDLQAARTMKQKDGEVLNSRQALAKKDAIISMVLDERKKEQDAIAADRKSLQDDRKLFEDENRRLDDENKELVAVKSNLERQVMALKQQLKSWQEGGSQLVFSFGVDSYYPNEVYDHLVEMLKSVDGSIPAEQLRHRQIYEAIMKANPSSGEMQKRKDAVADLLRNKRGLALSDIRAFENLGFTYSKDGPHHKFTMGSFFMTVPCTGSDGGRGWKNSIRDFNRNFFVSLKGDS